LALATRLTLEPNLLTMLNVNLVKGRLRVCPLALGFVITAALALRGQVSQ
jgi:hypothetical protein